jgi:hypothetical protein
MHVLRKSALWAAAAAFGLLAATTAPAPVAAATSTAPAADAPAVPDRYARQRLDWRPCPGAASLECAAMAVPRDWSRPGSGPALTVGVSRYLLRGRLPAADTACAGNPLPDPAVPRA